jgi:hypothetical protein
MERGRSILCRSAPGGAENNIDETRAPKRNGAAKNDENTANQERRPNV